MIEFTPSEGPPSAQRTRQSGQFQKLVDACHADPGEWFEVECETQKRAYGRATTLRKSYGLDARARGSVVFVRLAPEQVEANSDPVAV